MTLWQRATVTAALVGGKAGLLEDAAASMERYVMGMFPDGVRVERALVSGDELLDH